MTRQGTRQESSKDSGVNGRLTAVFHCRGKGYALGKTAQSADGGGEGEGTAAASPTPTPDAGRAAPAPAIEKPPPKVYKVTMWQGNVFQIDNGELRHPTDEVNRQFVADLSKGWVPEELRERNDTGIPVPVHINASPRAACCSHAPLALTYLLAMTSA